MGIHPDFSIWKIREAQEEREGYKRKKTRDEKERRVKEKEKRKKVSSAQRLIMREF